ncbi:P-loop containing nucleoside triphosphate hydrolase protein [Pisolithus tinctorius]|nr:P-loop containing nucleoside triphosphate hydrolase protein [Pisolithus tinctorius]
MSSQVPIRRKLVIVGDGACGKTSLLCSFALGEFPKEYVKLCAEIRLDGKPVQLALWDTAGQEEYERLRPLSYSKSHVILIAFAIDTPDSLDNVTVKWIEEVRSICGPTIPILLAERVANEIGARAYKECSALKIEGVDDVFEAATRASMLMREGVPSALHHRRKSSGRSGMGSHGDSAGGGWKCCVVC